MNKRILEIISLALLATFGMGAGSIPSKTLRFGSNISEDQTLIFNKGSGSTNPKIKWNNSSSQIQFSNDGTNFLSLGSGSGGGSGINVLSGSNGDMELGTQNWTGTPSPTSETSDVGNGSKSLAWNPTAAAQTLDSALVSLTNFGVLKGANCVAFVSSKGSFSSGDYTLQAHDGTNVLGSVSLIPTTQYTKSQPATFPCPTSGSIKLRLLANADAAEIKLDDAFLGSSELNVSQAKFVGQLFYPTTTNCIWSSTSTSYSDFSADTDCSSPTVSGDLTAPGTKVPHAVLSNAAPGNYYVEAKTAVTATSTVSMGCRLVDESNSVIDMMGSVGGAIDGGTDSYRSMMTLSGNISYSVSGNRTFKVQCRVLSAGTVNVRGDFEAQVQFTVYRFPLSQEQAVRFDQVGWKVDANIVGTSNSSLGTSNVTSYTEITESTLSLTQNAGSIGTEIACASGTASTGTTCSVAESIGIAFTVPQAGDVLACASFAHIAQGDSAGDVVSTTFQIVETTNTSSSVIQEGKSRMNREFSVGTGQSGAINGTVPFRVCGNFSFASAGKKTLRLEFEQAVSSTPTSSFIRSDGDVGTGQRDIHWEVYPITVNQPMPVLVNSVTTSSAGQERIERARVAGSASEVNACTSTPCTIHRQTGSWLSSVSRSGTGAYTLNIASGIFSGVPSCNITTGGGGFVVVRIVGTPTSTSFSWEGEVGGVDTDHYVDVFCMGPK